jgi:hypothetical protein
MKLRFLILIMLGAFAVNLPAQAAAPFGGDEDVKYSQDLWEMLVKAGLVGPDAVMSQPYDGQAPHGAVLDTIDSTVTVNGTTGAVIVKRNYGGPDVSVGAVATDPAKYLKAVTVMFKRKGYDADDKDWFWAKYKPDGSLDANPAGMQLAGKVAKGKPKGCIACHTAAPGGDLVFKHDRIQ